MKTLFTGFRNVAISGFFFLLPTIVIFIIIAKAGNAMTSIGARVAGVFGVSSIVGFKGSHIFTGLLMLAICIMCGLLVRFSFVAGFSKAVEKWMSKYIPGYDAYKAIAEEKLQNKTRILPYASALVRHQECWLPAYIVEQDPDGNYVIFLPDVPDQQGTCIACQRGRCTTHGIAYSQSTRCFVEEHGKGVVEGVWYW